MARPARAGGREGDVQRLVPGGRGHALHALLHQLKVHEGVQGGEEDVR